MTDEIRVVHYVNHFFGQRGAEEAAGSPPEVREGALGPGLALQQALGARGKVVATVICGDDSFAENLEGVGEQVLEMIRGYQPDLVVAGPAYISGRYGMACGMVCRLAQTRLNIPAVTAMHEENPGADLFKRDAFIIRTGDNARTMAQDMQRVVRLALKLVDGQEVADAETEGYIPRGIRKNRLVEWSAGRRATDMLLAKMAGIPFKTELPLPLFEPVAAPAPVNDMAHARIALITDGGLVPKGNPDRLESRSATKWFGYNISDRDGLPARDYESVHTGFDTTVVNQDPNRLVPVDAARELEQAGEIGKLHEEFLTTTGVWTSLDNARRIGREMAEKLKLLKVDGAILTST